MRGEEDEKKGGETHGVQVQEKNDPRPPFDLNTSMAMSPRTLGFGLAALGTAGAGYYRSDDVHTAVRCGRCVVTAGGCLLDYSSGLPMKEAHARASHRLRECLQANRGLYIKVGQHLGVLDYVLPPEYLDAMSCFYDAAPQSSWTSVERVIREDFGLVGKKGVDELFESIDHTPLASGSLAQVSERRRGESERGRRAKEGED